jgi:hypothetical protein
MWGLQTCAQPRLPVDIAELTPDNIVKRIVDQSYADFDLLEGVLSRVDQTR